MNVATIEMPRAEAIQKLRSYRRALHRRADEEYQAAMLGYEKLAEGHALVGVGQAIRSAPTDEKGRPKLAIARADRRQVRLSVVGHSHRISFDASSRNTGEWLVRERYPTLIREFSTPWQTKSELGYSLVPMVPPAARKESGYRPLSKFFVLWEVEQWADQRILAEPDRDPYLLEHVGGDLYAVLAEWDLTDLERAVMAGRSQT